MSETVLDDRDSAITYVDGVWRKGGNSREYQETSSWSISNEATATIDFYGTSIRVLGTINRRAGVPTNTTLNLAFVLQGESSSTVIAQSRARFEQTSPPSYNTQLYSSPQFTDNSVRRQLVIRNLTPDNLGFLCLDSVYIGGFATGPRPVQSESSPSPSSSPSSSSAVPPLSSAVTTSGSVPVSPESSSIASVSGSTTTSGTLSASSGSDGGMFAPAATDVSGSSDQDSGSGSSRDGGSTQAGSENEGSNTRPIVTGVLGALVGLLALGILCWFVFVRRRNSRRRRRSFGVDQDPHQNNSSPYGFGGPGNLELATSAAGSEYHLLSTTGQRTQDGHLPSTGEAQMREVFGGSGMSQVSGPSTKSDWSSTRTSQSSRPPFAGHVPSRSREGDDSVSPPPYTTHVP